MNAWTDSPNSFARRAAHRGGGTSLLLAACMSLCLAGCAITQQPAEPLGDESDRARPAPELPAEYAAALDLLAREQWAAAESALKAWADKRPEMSSTQVNLALLYRRTNRNDAARAAITKALEINPQQPGALNQQGIFAREDGDFDAAEAAYRKAIAADDRYPNAFLNLAILLDLYRHDVGAAMPYYQRYAQLIGEEQVSQQVASWIADANRRAGN